MNKRSQSFLTKTWVDSLNGSTERLSRTGFGITLTWCPSLPPPTTGKVSDGDEWSKWGKTMEWYLFIIESKGCIFYPDYYWTLSISPKLLRTSMSPAVENGPVSHGERVGYCVSLFRWTNGIGHFTSSYPLLRSSLRGRVHGSRVLQSGPRRESDEVEIGYGNRRVTPYNTGLTHTTRIPFHNCKVFTLSTPDPSTTGPQKGGVQITPEASVGLPKLFGNRTTSQPLTSVVPRHRHGERREV